MNDTVFINVPTKGKLKKQLQKIATETERSLAAVARYYISLGIAAEQAAKKQQSIPADQTVEIKEQP